MKSTLYWRNSSWEGEAKFTSSIIITGCIPHAGVRATRPSYFNQIDMHFQEQRE